MSASEVSDTTPRVAVVSEASEATHVLVILNRSSLLSGAHFTVAIPLVLQAVSLFPQAVYPSRPLPPVLRLYSI